MSTGPFHFHSLDLRPVRVEHPEPATVEPDTRPAGPWGAWSPPKLERPALTVESEESQRPRYGKIHPDWFKSREQTPTPAASIPPRTTMSLRAQKAFLQEAQQTLGCTWGVLALNIGVALSTLKNWSRGMAPMSQEAEDAIGRLLEAHHGT